MFYCDATFLFISSFYTRLHLTSCHSTSYVSRARPNSSDPFLCRDRQRVYGHAAFPMLRWTFQPAQRTSVNRHTPLLSLKRGVRDVMPQAGIPRIIIRVSEYVCGVSEMCTFWTFLLCLPGTDGVIHSAVTFDDITNKHVLELLMPLLPYSCR